MCEMTSRERFGRMYAHEEADRVPEHLLETVAVAEQAADLVADRRPMAQQEILLTPGLARGDSEPHHVQHRFRAGPQGSQEQLHRQGSVSPPSSDADRQSRIRAASNGT